MHRKSHFQVFTFTGFIINRVSAICKMIKFDKFHNLCSTQAIELKFSPDLTYYKHGTIRRMSIVPWH